MNSKKKCNIQRAIILITNHCTMKSYRIMYGAINLLWKTIIDWQLVGGRMKQFQVKCTLADKDRLIETDI